MNSSSGIEAVAGECAATVEQPLVGQVIDHTVADRLAATFATLADPTRARLLHALSLADELRVSDLATVLGTSQSAVSHQLRSLRDNRVVERRRDGRVAYYRLADQHVRHILADALRHALEPSAGTTPHARAAG